MNNLWPIKIPNAPMLYTLAHNRHYIHTLLWHQLHPGIWSYVSTARPPWRPQAGTGNSQAAKWGILTYKTNTAYRSSCLLMIASLLNQQNGHRPVTNQAPTVQISETQYTTQEKLTPKSCDFNPILSKLSTKCLDSILTFPSQIYSILLLHLTTKLQISSCHTNSQKEVSWSQWFEQPSICL